MFTGLYLYVQQRCRNINENTCVLRIDLANILSDADYDAVTVRLFATGIDYTVSDEGRNAQWQPFAPAYLFRILDAHS